MGLAVGSIQLPAPLALILARGLLTFCDLGVSQIRQAKATELCQLLVVVVGFPSPATAFAFLGMSLNKSLMSSQGAGKSSV